MKIVNMLILAIAMLLAVYSITSNAEPKTGKLFTNIDSYNAEHNNRSNNFYISEEPQNGDSCVCHAMANMFNALNNSKEKLTREMENNCAKWFAASFDEFSKTYPGEQFGGLINKVKGRDGVTTDEAIDKIVTALDDGKIVAVSVNMLKIYNAYSIENGVDFERKISSLINGIPHAFIITGLQRDQNGEVTYFNFADSSGPKRKYAVRKEVFWQAYNGRGKAIRGAYIPYQSIYEPISYKAN